MKRIITVIVLYLIVSCAYSQDIIVTKQGDTLKCQIVTKSDYDFNIRLNGRDTIVLSENVQYFFKSLSTDDLKGIDPTHFHFKVRCFGGPTKLLFDSIPYSGIYKDYLQGLSTGWHWGANLIWNPFKNYGFGLGISKFRTDNSIPDFLYVFTDGTSAKGILHDFIEIQSYSFLFEGEGMILKNKGKAHFTVGAGYTRYNENVTYLNFMTSSQANGLCLNFGAGIGIFAYKNIMLGIHSAFVYSEYNSTLMKGDNETIGDLGNVDSYSYNSRIDISASLTWHILHKRLKGEKNP